MSVSRSSPVQGSERLAARRRVYRRRLRIIFGILFVVLIGAAIWGSWQPAVRVSQIKIFGADASLIALAQQEMQGKSFGIFPRDSIFFLPEHAIRVRILAHDTHIAAVSIFREGFRSISIRVNQRTAIARWCGLAPTAGVDPYCYLFDASGYVYAAASTSDQTLVPYVLYDSLVGNTEEPLQATLANAVRLPALFDFARQTSLLGSPVVSVVVRADEVDDLLTSGTRITYVLGGEQDAFAALTSAKENINLSDGSVEYVDLRFPGKVYLKKKEASIK